MPKYGKQKIPGSFKEAEVIMLHKKGCKKDPNNYRSIFLLNVTGKILANIIRDRVEQTTEKTLLQTQFGFRSGRSCAHAIFCLKQAQQAYRLKKSPLLAAFMDLEKAFDSIPRDAIWQALAERGIEQKLTTL